MSPLAASGGPRLHRGPPRGGVPEGFSESSADDSCCEVLLYQLRVDPGLGDDDARSLKRMVMT